MTRSISLEDHYLSPSFEADPKLAGLYSAFPTATKDALKNIGDDRVAKLDAGAIDIQVVSHGPGAGDLKQCRDANDHLADAVKKHPQRLCGFAALPMSEPSAAATELQRCVETHGFVGALIENNAHGKHYDDEAFWPVFAKAEELDVPLYIHPAFPEGEFAKHFEGNYDSKAALALGAFGWGWHADTGLHVLKLHAAGVFDRFPKLKIVIGHMGEMLPFQLSRCIRADSRGLLGGNKRSFQQVWDENIWITTSGLFDLAPMSCLLMNAKIEKIMFSVDYPFSATTDGSDFLKKLEESGMVTAGQLEMIAHKNARSLLKI